MSTPKDKVVLVVSPFYMESFDPHSPQAMFARIDEHLIAQDKAADVRDSAVKEKLDSIEDQVKRTNGRVTSLEEERWRQRGIVTAIALLIGALSWVLPFLWPLVHK